MAKESCSNCATRLIEPVSFCPTCDRPTPHANDAERLDWDLKQWRAHVDKSVAAGMIPSADGLRAAGSVVIVSPDKPRAPMARPAMVQPMGATAAARVAEPMGATAPVQSPIQAVPALKPSEKKKKERRARQAHVAKPRLARRKKEGKEPEAFVALDADHAFAYRACATCEATDWIIRTKRNDDETWNYWCVRCSRSFKTENKLHQAVKPFLSAGIVVGGLLSASILLLH